MSPVFSKGILLLILLSTQFDIGMIPADDPKVADKLLSIFGRISGILRDQRAMTESSLPDWALAAMEYEIVE